MPHKEQIQCLRVMEQKTKEEDYFVYISSKSVRELGICHGDVVLITNVLSDRKIAIRIKESVFSNENLDNIQISEFNRRKLNVNIGDNVQVCKTKIKLAKYIVLAAIPDLKIRNEQNFAHLLNNQVVVLGDILTFMVMGSNITFVVVKINPNIKAIKITLKTKITFHKKSGINHYIYFQRKSFGIKNDELSLRNLGIRKISEIRGILDYPFLQSIDLSHNQLTTMEGLQNLPILSHLDLSYNRLTTVEDLQHFPILSHLDLSHNRLTTIEGLQRFPNLIYLNLSYDHLMKVEGLDNFPILSHLDLSHNHLMKFEGMQRLPMLTYIDFSHNNISTIKDLEGLIQLDQFNLFNNKSTMINNDAFPLLSYIFLQGNPIASQIGDYIEFTTTPIDQEYYKEFWGFDPIKSRKPTTQGYLFETWYSLSSDPSLEKGGIQIGARVEANIKRRHVQNFIVFRKENHVVSIPCIHTIILSGPANEILPFLENRKNNPLSQDGTFSKDLIFSNVPANLPPWEHFAALKSFVEGLATIGIQSFITRHYNAMIQESIEPYGIDSMIQTRILRTLNKIAPQASRRIVYDWLMDLVESSSLVWIENHSHLFNEIDQFSDIIKEILSNAPKEWRITNEIKLQKLLESLDTKR